MRGSEALRSGYLPPSVGRAQQGRAGGGGASASFACGPAGGVASLQGDRSTAEPTRATAEPELTSWPTPPEGGPGPGGARVLACRSCRWAQAHCVNDEGRSR